METLDDILKRRSIRKYKDEAISDEVVSKILYYGTKAPSAHNKQPWQFVVVKDKDIIKQIADLMITKAKLEEKVNGTIIATANTMKEAPILILVFNKYNDYKLINNMLSIGACIQNMLLAATSYGLGSLWIRNTVIVQEEIKEMFQKKDMTLASVVSLGIADEEPKERPRIALEEIIEWK
ncbi:MAG: nitroreductase [Bacilli bacterium]|nr:nitroreductase [Bacilli bacterium]